MKKKISCLLAVIAFFACFAQVWAEDSTEGPPELAASQWAEAKVYVSAASASTEANKTDVTLVWNGATGASGYKMKIDNTELPNFFTDESYIHTIEANSSHTYSVCAMIDGVYTSWSEAQAFQYVSDSNITQDTTTWNSTTQTYVVTQSLTINEGKKLVIGKIENNTVVSGVEVWFVPGTSLTVNGELNAIGTATVHNRIASSYPNTTWGGIVNSKASSKITMEHTVFSDYTALLIKGETTLKNNVFHAKGSNGCNLNVSGRSVYCSSNKYTPGIIFRSRQ